LLVAAQNSIDGDKGVRGTFERHAYSWKHVTSMWHLGHSSPVHRLPPNSSPYDIRRSALLLVAALLPHRHLEKNLYKTFVGTDCEAPLQLGESQRGSGRTKHGLGILCQITHALAQFGSVWR
jgi:hypothetical protein